MQTLQFKTNEEIIVLSDLGQSMIDGEAVPIVLYNFDPNSLSISTDTVRCIEMAGQHTVSTTVNPRTLTVTVTYSGITETAAAQKLKDTEAAMYILRRRLLKAFPLGKKGELAYTNANGTYHLDAYATEYPVIERVTGTLCKATLYLTADYPYWHQTVAEEPVEVTAGSGIRCRPQMHGDMVSPMLCEIRCIEKINGISKGAPYCTLWLDGAGNEEIKLVKNIEEDQAIVCSTGLNNEVYVKLLEFMKADGSIYTEKNGSNYVEFVSSRDPAEYPSYEWVFAVHGTSGKLSIQVYYQNIYLAV